MGSPTTPAPRCALEGCNAWALRGKLYCFRHQQQYDQNVALGAEDPTPVLVGGKRIKCRVWGCQAVVVKDSEYCARHTAEGRGASLAVGDAARTAATISEGFEALLAHLGTDAPDCLAVLQREVDMLTAARRILAAHARMSGRRGWKMMSPVAFMRLWIASAEAITNLTKARFVMENATSADFDRLLGGVYSRIEREGVVVEQRALNNQPLLPGLVVEGETNHGGTEDTE